MASLLTYGLAALGTGLVGWWWFGAPKTPAGPPGVKPGTPLSGVFVDRETAKDDWTRGALKGAVRGYTAGAAGVAEGEFRPETDAIKVPASVNAPTAYVAGYPCGARKGFSLGRRMRALVGPAATGTSFDPTTKDARTTIEGACADGFAMWWTAHGTESVLLPTSVSGYAPHRLPRRLLPTQLSPILGRTFLTFAPPHRV
jgi:hypothetical protein